MNPLVKRKISLIPVFLFALILFTGCSNHTTVSLQKDGSGKYEEVLSIEKDLWDKCLAEEELAEESYAAEKALQSYYRALYPQAEISITNETTDGTDLKVIHLTMPFKNLSEYRQILSASDLLCSATLHENYFSRSNIYMPLEEDTGTVSGITDELEQLLSSNEAIGQIVGSQMQNMSDILSMTFPYEVTDANGAIQEDGKTVVWDMKQMAKAERLYALFHTSDSKAVPKYQGAENGKAYNTGVSLTITSDNLLKQVKINEETTQSDSLFLSAEGIYNITALDVNGNSSRIKFRIDKTKPSVSGVKNGKTYKTARTIRFSDKGSGIRHASLNGLQIKTGQKVSKKGTYRLVVTDKAGNQKTVAFQIR